MSCTYSRPLLQGKGTQNPQLYLSLNIGCKTEKGSHTLFLLLAVCFCFLVDTNHLTCYNKLDLSKTKNPP